MIIRNHRLDGARYVAASGMGDEIRPRLIVIHETAGRLTKHSTVDYFKSKGCQVSAHFVIERDGEITQMVPCNRKAFHAGISEWQGRKYCNTFSIGVELVGPGKLDETGRAWFGEVFPDAIDKATEAHGNGKWLPFTSEQIEACRQLVLAIVAAYPDCNDVAGHFEVSPKRKVDPNPLFPLEQMREALAAPDMEDVPSPPPKPIAMKVAAGTAGASGVTAMTVDPSWWMFWAWPWNDWLASLGCDTGIACASSLGAYAGKPTAWIGLLLIVGAVYMGRRAKA